MISFENTKVYGWEASIRGMRNSMNSWDRSDTVFANDGSMLGGLGKNDYGLMMKLATSSDSHGKFLRMITVTTDITAPLYWWKEYDTYKIGTVANSCSTMHTIHTRDLTLDDFSHEHLDEHCIDILEHLIFEINCQRQFFANYEGCKEKYGCDLPRKDFWWHIIQLLPSSFNQKRTVQLNYQVLRKIYNERYNHRLDEWQNFCCWIETAPYHELITTTGQYVDVA